VQVVDSMDKAEGGQGAVELVIQDRVQVVLPLKGLFNAAKEVQRLEKQRGKLEKDLSSLQGRLGNRAFVERAPAPVVAQVQEEAKEVTEQMTLIDGKLAQARALL
jgi:valyl-tRNA synthetase